MRFHGLLVGLLVLTWASVAPAHGAAPARPLRASDLAPSPLKRQILDVERRVKELGLRPELVKAPLAEAIRAAERARSARVAGDARHGSMLDKLGEQWVSVARELLRATELERKAAVAARRARELTIKAERAEALLVEQHARLGRLGAEVKRLESKVKDDASRTKTEERERIAPPTAPAAAPKRAPKKERR